MAFANARKIEIMTNRGRQSIRLKKLSVATGTCFLFKITNKIRQPVLLKTEDRML
jgi:hypothetical protein